MSRRVRRYEISADEKAHSFYFYGDVLSVESTRDNPNDLEFWVEDEAGAAEPQRKLRVFGDGQILPDDAIYQGTTGRSPDGSVWHLYEVVV